MKPTILSCITGLLVATNVLANELIVNGSFENPNIPVGGYEIYGAIPGWAATGYGIEIQDHAYRGSGTPFDGDQFVELDSRGNSRMSQTVTTVPGGWYEFSFAYSPRPYVSQDSNPISVFFDGALLVNLTGSGEGYNDSTWTVYRYTVTANRSTATVEFAAGGVEDSLGGYLDAVSFSPHGVPDAASSSLLLGSSFVLLSLLRRKFKS